MPGADCGSDHELLITKFRLEKVREFQKNIYFCFIDYFPYSSVGKESPCNAGSPYSWVGKIPWNKGKATHSSIQAWRLPWTIQSVGLQRAGHF